MIGIAFKQKCVRKYWPLTTIEHMETKEIHNYVIDLNKCSNKKSIQWAKSTIWTLNIDIYEPNP
jgi:hypothetical protein